jgi:AmmeMemoRadiSam system protein A
VSIRPTRLPELAQLTVETWIRAHCRPEIDRDCLLPFRQQRAGVFVTLQKQVHGRLELRGCIGTIAPTQPDIVAETLENAISAAVRDPRFQPVSVPELASLNYEVSVLHEPEPAAGLEMLDVDRYGVIVVNGERRGLLLPAIESIRSVEEQVSHAMYKAGIRPGEPISLFRFQVDKYV